MATGTHTARTHYIVTHNTHTYMLLHSELHVYVVCIIPNSNEALSHLDM